MGQRMGLLMEHVTAHAKGKLMASPMGLTRVTSMAAWKEALMADQMELARALRWEHLRGGGMVPWKAFEMVDLMMAMWMAPLKV